jgi:signal transduction histidine kinase
MQIIIDRYKKLARIELVIVLILSILVFAGWLFDVNELKKGLLDSVSMNPVTCLILIITITAFSYVTRPEKYYQVIGKCSALIVIVFGLLRIYEIINGESKGITYWLFTTKIEQDNFGGMPNTIAPNTAICILFTGLSLILYHLNFRKSSYIPDWLAIIVALLSFGSITGYLYETDKLYTIYGYIPMALPTAICYFLVSTSILLYRSKTGLFRIFTKPLAGSRMARYLVPFALAIPVVSGIIRLYGESRHWFSSSFSTAVIMMINFFIMIILIWRGAIFFNRAAADLEYERKRTDELNEQLRIKETKKMEQELLQAKINRQKELMQATIEGQEKEKKQLWMELHDHINQILASTKLYLEVAKSEESLRMEMIQKSSDQIIYAINEIRNLSRSLVLHDTNKDAILENIIILIRNVEKSASIAIDSEISSQAMNSLDKKQQVSIYRIIEEQLQNIIKHANAGNVIIQLGIENKHVKLEVKDDGRGFDVNQKKGGIGLSNISSRVASMDSELEVISAPGHGCQLRVTIPVSNPVQKQPKILHY